MRPIGDHEADRRFIIRPIEDPSRTINFKMIAGDRSPHSPAPGAIGKPIKRQPASETGLSPTDAPKFIYRNIDISN
jgi:hypothetical protein